MTYIPDLDNEELWASEAIDDADSVIASLLDLSRSCIQLKIRPKDARQLLAELSLHNDKHNIELDTDKWLFFCRSLIGTDIAEAANAVENKLLIFMSKHLR